MASAIPKVGRISSIWRYPVKSMAGQRIATSAVGERGLHADRTWAVRDLRRNATTGAKRLPGHQESQTSADEGRLRSDLKGREEQQVTKTMNTSIDTRDPQSWSARLWADIEPIFAAILAHPFVVGLTDGSLDSDVFAHYVGQDGRYLRDYARALAVVAAKAPTMADTAMFARHSAEVFDVELQLHTSLLPDLGLDTAVVDAAPASPTTQAYTSYLLATAYGDNFADGLAAVLPCYWIYARVGNTLVERGSSDPRYQRWIDSYGGEVFNTTAAEVLALTDRIGPTLSPAAEADARAHFVTTARYEWMFWDSAYRREAWPV